ncbi:unnamed protein product [Urochloa humidicola]
MSHAQPGRPGGVNNDACREEESSAPTEAPVTVGQALQAAALSPAGARPVDRADASAVEAAEKSATGLGRVVPGGVAAAVQQAAETNEQEAAAEEGKVAVTLRDVLGKAPKLMQAGDRAATWVDAEKVAAATGGSAGMEGGGMGEVADALAAAAQINEGSTLE